MSHKSKFLEELIHNYNNGIPLIFVKEMRSVFIRKKISHLVPLVLIVAILMCVQARAAQKKDSDHPLDAHLSKTYTDDLPGLLQKKYVRVLTAMNRTNFFLDNGKAYGFEYALLKEYEKYLNTHIGSHELKVTFEFIPVSRDRLLPGLVKGYGDIAAAGLTITRKREETIDFTRPYLTGIDELLVTYRKVPPPKNIDALSGKRIFVRKSSSYYESLIALNHRLTQKKLRPVKIVAADESLETEDILEMVNSGAIKRTIADSDLAGIWAEVLDHIKVYKNIKFRKGGQIAWAVRKDNPLLKQSLNKFIKSHRKGTLLGNIFFKRYYEHNKWIRNPLKDEGSKKIRELRALFEKYAKRYDFDWRLIMAMAFQESGLNPDKRSARGAVGLMQILPSTAADPKIGIKHINRRDNNIHAGVKYLNFLRHRYFSKKSIRPRDRVRFSLASYNAGPAKIEQARKRAAKMGLNPNRWFRNVEIAVLRIVGQETVQYVSNINKYYVIYKSAGD